MSYPSIKDILKKKNLTVENATQEELEEALAETFKKDLPLGVQTLSEMAQEAHKKRERIVRIIDPGSEEGKQVARLAGTDIARQVMQHYFMGGAGIGFYNCCSPVVVPKGAQLNLSIQEQIMLQNGQLASADC